MTFAIAKLIQAMGMFIHDLNEIKNGNNEIYTEEAYYTIAEEILHYS